MNTKITDSVDESEPIVETLTKEDIDALPEPLRELMRQLADTLDN
jgi:hypothetical protein